MVSTQTEMGSHVISAAHVAARFGRIVRRSASDRPNRARLCEGLAELLAS